jgi:hypothetical protein
VGTDAHGWHSTVAAQGSEFDGFGGGLVRKARTRPKGMVHAVSPVAFNETLCGLSLASLVLFPDLRFGRSHWQCPECRAVSNTSI